MWQCGIAEHSYQQWFNCRVYLGILCCLSLLYLYTIDFWKKQFQPGLICLNNSAGKKEKPNNVTIEVKVYKTLSKRSFLLFSYSTYDLMVFFKTLQRSHGYIFSPN